MTYLELHKEWMEKGRLPAFGLCNCLKNRGMILYDELCPTVEEKLALLNEGYCKAFWGSGLGSFNPGVATGYTPLRQTLVLLMAALNGEFD